MNKLSKRGNQPRRDRAIRTPTSTRSVYRSGRQARQLSRAKSTAGGDLESTDVAAVASAPSW